MGLSGSLLPGAVHVTLILHYFLGWHIPLFWGPKAIQTGVNSSYFFTCPDLWFLKNTFNSNQHEEGIYYHKNLALQLYGNARTEWDQGSKQCIFL